MQKRKRKSQKINKKFFKPFSKEFFGIFLRYFLLVLLGAFNLWIFYAIFTPLTIYLSYFFLSLIDEGTILISDNIFRFRGSFAQIIPACVAGAAYYLLCILNLTTPMSAVKRVKSFSFIILSFFVLNVARIIIFTFLMTQGYQFFDLAHRTFWYFGSTVLVVLIWFANIFLFNIRTIPIYSDFKNIFGDILKRKTIRSNSSRQ